MEIHLTPEQESFVRQAVDAGRFATPEQAMVEILGLWTARERQLLELRADIQIGLDQLDRGEGIVITEDSMNELVTDIGRRGRERAARQQGKTVR